MKRTLFPAGALLGAALLCSIYACKKNNTTPARSAKYQLVEGAWQQADITLAVAVSVNWWLDEYDAVLKLNPSDTVNDPHWINSITDSSLSLSMTVTIPGLGAAPLALQLKKQ